MNDIWLEYDPAMKRPLPRLHSAQHELRGPPMRKDAGQRCPHCNSIIYSRRNKLCGVCNQELPAELLFSQAEARRVESVLRSEQLRHRAWLAKAFEQAMVVSH